MRGGDLTAEWRAGLIYPALFAAVLMHAIEATSGLPAWIAERPISVGIPAAQFERAIIGLTLAVGLITMVARYRSTVLAQGAGAAAAGALLADVVIYAAVSLATKSYLPGTATAILLVLPVAAVTLTRLPLTRRATRLLALAGAVALAPLTWGALWLAGFTLA